MRASPKLPLIFGLSLATFIIHWNGQPFLNAISIAQLSFLVSILCVPYYFIYYKPDLKALIGKKVVYIPLLIIIGSMALRPLVALLTGVSQFGISQEIAGMLYGGYYLAIYIMSRDFKEKVFTPFMWGLVIASVSVVIFGIVNPGVKTGGIIHEYNYDIATGFIVFALFVSTIRRQWWLSALAIVGLFFTGADEAIFACVFMFAVVLIRRDFSRKLLVPVAALVITLCICTPLGITQKLYYPTVEKVALAKEVVEETAIGRQLDKIIPDSLLSPLNRITEPIIDDYIVDGEKDVEKILYDATNYRLFGNMVLDPIQPFGYGFNIQEFYIGIPHNTWLIIIHQLGILAALAWTWIVFYGVFKTPYKYAWCAIISLSVFDHYIFTMAGSFWWMLIGVSTASNIKEDLIFKELKDG